MNGHERTAAANASNKRAGQWRLDKVATVIRQFERDGRKLDASEIARLAGVGRSYLYQNADAERLMTTALERQSEAVSEASRVRTEDSVGQWRERALNAEAQLDRAKGEILLQRNEMAELLGVIRTFEDTTPTDAVQRLVSENHTLKRRVKEMSSEVDRLDDRLAAARENNRFLDKRIADLEVELLEGPG